MINYSPMALSRHEPILHFIDVNPLPDDHIQDPFKHFHALVEKFEFTIVATFKRIALAFEAIGDDTFKPVLSYYVDIQ